MKTLTILGCLFFVWGCTSAEDEVLIQHWKYPPLNADMSFDSLKTLVDQRIDSVKDYPHRRYEIRAYFYEQFGEGHFTKFGFGNSEIAFLKWEARGVLKPPHSDPPGSEWWSAVNLKFIYWAELAAFVHISGIDTTGLNLNTQIQHWLLFLDEPSSKHWYMAHNSSIIEGYHLYRDLAVEEVHAEQVFMNMVLYRLLYAQAMVEAESYAMGRLGQFLAKPSGIAVDFIVHDPFFYPETYPLNQEEKDIILGKKHAIGELEVEFSDDVLILPHLEEMYTTSAEINGTPSLLMFMHDGKPIYPHIDPQFTN